MASGKQQYSRSLDVDATAFFAVGDIHGKFGSIKAMVETYGLRDACIIVCGDCALGFAKPQCYKNELKKLNRMLDSRNITLVLVRGNHDNPKWFSEGTVNTKRIVAVQDYTVINGCILCVGGAVSYDRMDRQELKESAMAKWLKYKPQRTREDAMKNTQDCWWPDEQPVFSQNLMDLIRDNGLSVRFVVTHTCPSSCYPQNFSVRLNSFLMKDEGLMDDIKHERSVMDRLRDRLSEDGHQVEDWYYGHFHEHKTYEDGGVRYHLLDCVPEYGHCMPDWAEIPIDGKVFE